MNDAIAIVGLACRYADASSPEELWENALAGRRAFRRIPRERLNLADYCDVLREQPDTTYSGHAALIEGFELDRVRLCIGKQSYQSADVAHWLALDVAQRALIDAGFGESAGSESLPRETTGVLVGNSLTGDGSRAHSLRLRWPYVRRQVAAWLGERGLCNPAQITEHLAELERRYKEPFAEVNEETLAGGLSNTIAGRIANHFDLHGGGYAIDGACASSLLALAQACSALESGDLDCALAGGVDVSLDPFELVGFAKTGALAADEMRVYDAHPTGFLPGEGAGFAVLMRERDARAQGRRIRTLIRGWGISSDGSGGLTRPKLEGQLLALRRAYARAGCGPESVGYFEGHGTGTAVGDAVELAVLSQARRAAGPSAAPAAIGSIKANIGHTKAAAGMAGLIKASLALEREWLPPTTGCDEPHAELCGARPALRVLHSAEPWPLEAELCAGVSSMGFGGINAHIVLGAAQARRRPRLASRESRALRTAQDAELFLFRAPDVAGLQAQLAPVRARASGLSQCELTDLAAELQRRLQPGRLRAALVAGRPEELAAGLDRLGAVLARGEESHFDAGSGPFLSSHADRPRIGFLFPGQGVALEPEGGALARSFAGARELYRELELPRGSTLSTAVAQPALAAASLAGLRVLRELGLEAELALGHSLGELVALCWAGCMSEDTLVRLAAARGAAMEALEGPRGAMASLAAGAEDVRALIGDERVWIAGLNAPLQTVVAGEVEALERVLVRARERGLAAHELRVRHAFHSPLVEPAGAALAPALARADLRPPSRRVLSSVLGGRLPRETDLSEHLRRQIGSPVRFAEALEHARGSIDLWIEVGAGTVLAGLARENDAAPALSIEAGSRSLAGLLRVLGAAFALGVPLDHAALWCDRLTRPYSLEREPRFFESPCEQVRSPAPVPAALEQDEHDEQVERVAPATCACGSGKSTPTRAVASAAGESAASARSVGLLAEPSDACTCGQEFEPRAPASALELLRELIASRCELPLASIRPESRLLDDLHLNSLAVGELLAQAARRLGLGAPLAPTEYARASVEQAALALDDLRRTGRAAPDSAAPVLPPGIGAWARAFEVLHVPRERSSARSDLPQGQWNVLASGGPALAEELRVELGAVRAGNGLALCLPAEAGARELPLLLRAVRDVLDLPAPARCLLIQPGASCAPLFRTLHLEHPEVDVCVLDVKGDQPEAARWAALEAAACRGYVEARHDERGERHAPALRALELPASPSAAALGPQDLLVVSGGGKGIAAECALALALASGAGVALLGRSDPQRDAELAANLERFRAAGADWRYYPTDVGEAAAVERSLRAAESDFGRPVSALLHGAGLNRPKLLRELETADCERTLAPKLAGLEHLLAAIDPERLRLLVAFGSLIARTGMAGEGDYALANEWLARAVERWQATHPRCRCLAIEWSVWSGAGMGERLGRIDALAREGIGPISVERGVELLTELLRADVRPTRVVVAGRMGRSPCIAPLAQELPLLRFVERVRVHVPGVELVADAELDLASDPYLDDHAYAGQRLLPAVLGLEAMAEVAMALCARSTPPCFEDVRFERPVVLPAEGKLGLRLAALLRTDGAVEVALRCETSGWQVDHFRALCRFEREPRTTAEPRAESSIDLPKGEPVALDPARELYGDLLFQRGRFQRLAGYRELSARACLAELSPEQAHESWFEPSLPQRLVLGDPGARDACLHAIQACIPHQVVLPISVERVWIDPSSRAGTRWLCARERAREGDTWIYDLEAADEGGRVCERWQGLRLRALERHWPSASWPPALLGPYLERSAEEHLAGARLSVALEPGVTTRATRGARALERAAGGSIEMLHRPDGKPELAHDAQDRSVSISHARGLSLAVVGTGALGCDLEPIATRTPELWLELLGPDRCALAERIARDAREDLDTAATRVWAAGESLQKAGATALAPLSLTSIHSDGWIELASGELTALTLTTSLRDHAARLAIALCTRKPHARLRVPAHGRL